jgi:hypothetical protein
MGRENVFDLDRPLYREVSTGAVGVGLDATFTFPTDKFIRILSVEVVLTTSAVVANRRMVIDVASALTMINPRIVAPFTQAANLTYQYKFLGGMSFNVQTIADNIFTVGWPHEIIYSPAATISTLAVNLDANDNITNFNLVWLEWQALS